MSHLMANWALKPMLQAANSAVLATQTAQNAAQHAIQVAPAGPNQMTPDQQYEIARMALRPGGAGQLGLLVPLAFFAMIVLVGWLISRRRLAQVRAQAELRKQLIDKFGSGQELTAFLESRGGQQFLDEMRQAGDPLRFLPGGIIVTMLGLAFLGLTAVRSHFVFPGVILLAIGIGLLLSAAIGHKLMSKRHGHGFPGTGSSSGIPSIPPA